MAAAPGRIAIKTRVTVLQYGSARRAPQQITPLGQAAGPLGRPKVVLAGGVTVAELIEQMRPYRIDAVMPAKGGIRRHVVEFGEGSGRTMHHRNGDGAVERDHRSGC